MAAVVSRGAAESTSPETSSHQRQRARPPKLAQLEQKLEANSKFLNRRARLDSFQVHHPPRHYDAALNQALRRERERAYSTRVT